MGTLIEGEEVSNLSVFPPQTRGVRNFQVSSVQLYAAVAPPCRTVTDHVNNQSHPHALAALCPDTNAGKNRERPLPSTASGLCACVFRVSAAHRPGGEAIMRTAMSACEVPVIMFLMKSRCPGASMMVKEYFSDWSHTHTHLQTHASSTGQRDR